MAKMTFEKAKADAELKAKTMTREQLEQFFVIVQVCEKIDDDDEN